MKNLILRMVKSGSIIKRNTVILNLVSLTLIDNMIIMIVLIIDNV